MIGKQNKTFFFFKGKKKEEKKKSDKKLKTKLCSEWTGMIAFVAVDVQYECVHLKIGDFYM